MQTYYPTVPEFIEEVLVNASLLSGKNQPSKHEILPEAASGRLQRPHDPRILQAGGKLNF
jgi:hypothetical protein